MPKSGTATNTHSASAAVVDSDQVQSRASRREAFARWAESGSLVIGTHFADPTAGRLVSVGDGAYRLDV